MPAPMSAATNKLTFVHNLLRILINSNITHYIHRIFIARKHKIFMMKLNEL